MDGTKHISELVDPWLADLWLARVEQLMGGCWNCGRLDCPEPDGETCHAYVASMELNDMEIPF